MTGTGRELLDDIAALVAIPSVSSVSPRWDMSNRPVIDWLAGRLESIGFEVSVLPVPGLPGKANLVATLGRGDGGLILAGHTDTVPCDETLWKSDPWKLTERDQRLYGLGTTDMKAFLALAMAAAREVDAAQLRAPLILLATADEESTMSGARALSAGSLGGRYAVIGEPTGLRPVRQHKGVLMERISVTGRSGHSSDPSLGRNALDGMHAVLGTLIGWRAELAAGKQDDAYAVPYTTLNLGRIGGGDNPNRICGHCELDIDMRPLPGVSRAELRANLHSRVAGSLSGRELEFACTPLYDGLDALVTPASSPLVQAVESLTGAEAGSVPFATEGPLLRDLGLDVVVIGPGELEQAHQPDEYLRLDRVRPTLELLRGLIRRFCLS